MRVVAPDERVPTAVGVGGGHGGAGGAAREPAAGAVGAQRPDVRLRQAPAPVRGADGRGGGHCGGDAAAGGRRLLHGRGAQLRAGPGRQATRGPPPALRVDAAHWPPLTQVPGPPLHPPQQRRAPRRRQQGSRPAQDAPPRGWRQGSRLALSPPLREPTAPGRPPGLRLGLCLHRRLRRILAKAGGSGTAHEGVCDCSVHV
mmetsp:Transcript_7776/g.32750  ORF Transcript_7776/g.32750 Transcript_7776/m.32750 type:complete len:201 (+) Transcript_7776:504-1106(+)